MVICHIVIIANFAIGKNGKSLNPKILQSKHLFHNAQSINAQSICTHNSCFEKMGWFVTMKKRSKIWVAEER